MEQMSISFNHFNFMMIHFKHAEVRIWMPKRETNC